MGDSGDGFGVCFVAEREERECSGMAAVPNGSQANRISNLVPLPTSEYHKDINISGGSYDPPTDLLPFHAHAAPAFYAGN